LLAFAFSDSAYTYRMLQRAYTPGWPDLGWVLAMLLLALATQLLRRLPAQAPYRGPSLDEAPSLAAAPLWVMLLPYILVPSVFVLIISVWHTRADGPLVVGTYCSGLLLLLFIFLRQLFSLQETRRLNHRLHLAQQALREKQEALHAQNAALEQANTRLGMLATTDPLTELPNHRALLTSLTHEQECAQRNQRSYAVLFLDLDHFKEFNDGYGHTAGDVALFEFAQLLGRSMRTTDTVGRWGGEEFVAVLPETEASDALAIAQHLRTTVNQQPFAVGSGLYLTCTIGLACYPAHGETLDAIVNAADQAMYAAKRLGRNQVRPIDDPAVQFVLTRGNCEGSREETTLLGFIEAFCSLIEERDPLLAEHSRAVACLVQQLAMSMGVSGQEAQMMSLAGQLHDLGKISLPDAILQKPAPLTSEEWQQMKRHVCVGADMLARIPSLHSLAPIVRAHHERWNGTGYPDHLKGEEIPFAARLIGVADSYLAMTMDRPYQKALPSEVALGELQHCAGSLFDPMIVRALGELLVKRPFFLQTAEAATAERVMYSH
ncbi:MAG TPA: diguanylate cyclase, partial [Ktedonobacteraceae bacterium]|nr:diguanylate cyclase [Ktedonobacteraceae bacterium]